MHASSGWLASISALLVVASLCTAPSSARAHPDLDKAVASAEEAEFDAALAGFEKALDSGTLTRDELVVLLTERALVLHALGQRGALARDLATLALIEPGHDLGRRAPPELVDAFAQATKRQGGAVEITASCGPSGAGLRVTAQVTGQSDPSLASVILRTRRDQGAETRHDDNDVEVAVKDGESLSYSAELVGMGNVVLARDGSSSQPKSCGAPQLEEPPVLGTGTDGQDGKNRKLWLWVGAGGIVAITAITVGIVVATKGDGSGNTSVGRPMVTFE